MVFSVCLAFITGLEESIIHNHSADDPTPLEEVMVSVDTSVSPSQTFDVEDKQTDYPRQLPSSRFDKVDVSQTNINIGDSPTSQYESALALSDKTEMDTLESKGGDEKSSSD